MAGALDYLVDSFSEGFSNIVNSLLHIGYSAPGQFENGSPASLKPSEVAPYLIDKYKSKPGDPGYFDPGSFADPNYATSIIPGFSEVQTSTDMARYWSDYRKNTHKEVRYPGVAYHSPSLGRTAESVMGMMDWWK